MGTIYIGIILLMRVVQSLSSKNSSILLPKGAAASARYFGYTKLLAALCASIFVFAEGGFPLDGKVLLISALSGAALTISSISSLIAMKSGTVVLSSMFGTAGLIIPCICGVFLFGETMSAMQLVGIAVFFISAWLLIQSSKQIYPHFSLKTFALLAVVLVSNGLTMLLQKIYALWLPDGSVSMFSFLTFSIPAVVLYLYALPQKGGRGKIAPKLYLYGALGAVAVFIINQLATLCASLVPSVVLFTFINGGGTIIAAIVAAALYREKITWRSAAGIVLGVLSLIIIKAF